MQGIKNAEATADMKGSQKYNGELKWIVNPVDVRDDFGVCLYSIHSLYRLIVSNNFLSRVHDVKYRFYHQCQLEPTQLFLGPAELLELHDYIKELERAGLIKKTREVSDKNVLAGMTIIELASDGMRAGITNE